MCPRTAELGCQWQSPGGDFGGQPGLAALLHAPVGRGSGGHLAEQLGYQAGLQIGLDVMPGVEPDLPGPNK